MCEINLGFQAQTILLTKLSERSLYYLINDFIPIDEICQSLVILFRV